MGVAAMRASIYFDIAAAGKAQDKSFLNKGHWHFLSVKSRGSFMW